uniref:Uncharacterized protein n=2 Tax=Ceratitis capitata TaxID=7213 RepID=W8BAF3_CERCA
MQAALMLGSKSRVARGGKLRKLGGRLELPSNIATKEIAPFPRYPPESWCTRGRAAWQERGRRCSVQEAQQQAPCHRRWVKRNRVQDASLGGSSDDEDFLGVLRGPSTFANAFLYVGLGTIALGLVIAFVGTGEKGFKTVELRLIGPSLIGLGFVCCLLRILLCICPSHCISTNKKNFKKDCNKTDADYTTSLLRGESKRVSIARRPAIQPKYPLAHKRNSNKILNEGMEALRQIATTSLFMQNEQKTSLNRVVPIIKEPGNINERIPKKTEFSNDEELYDESCREKEICNEDNSKDANSICLESVAKITTKTARKVSLTSPESPTNVISKKMSNNVEIDDPAASLEQQTTTFTSFESKLSRQRIPLNHKMTQDIQPQFLTPSIATNYLPNADLLMETSLTINQPKTSTPPLIHSANSVLNNSYNFSGFIENSSTGAVPKISSSATASSITTASVSEKITGVKQSLAEQEHTSLDRKVASSIALNVTSNISSYVNTSIVANTNISTTNTTIGTHMSKIVQPVVCLPGQIEESVTALTKLSNVTQDELNKTQFPVTGFSKTSFMFPTPLLSSSDTESVSSLQATITQKRLSAADQPQNGTTSKNMTHDSKYVPQHNHNLSVYEPELLLSPAKLGQ